MTTSQSDPPIPALEQEPGGKMSFFEHLVDLRKRLINSALAIAIGAGVGVSISQRVFGYIALPMREALRKQNLDDRLVDTGPAGALNFIITLGIYIGAGP